MTDWKYKVHIKHLLDDDESYEHVVQVAAAIADVLDKAPCFTGFSTKRFRKIPEGDDVVTSADYLNKLLDRMYDFADSHLIWIE